MVYCVFCRFVVLIIDEMKIREDLVFDKTGTCLHGFVNLGDVNNQLRQLEMQPDTKKPHDCLATQMLTVMVRGIFIKLEFPYASFPTQGIHTYVNTNVTCCSLHRNVQLKNLKLYILVICRCM